jgi:hypothetical protein
MKLLDTTATLIKPDKVDAVAADLKSNDPDWDYIVRHDPKGTGDSLIDIYDEDGEFVATY